MYDSIFALKHTVIWSAQTFARLNNSTGFGEIKEVDASSRAALRQDEGLCIRA